jgi:predicted secreted protein
VDDALGLVAGTPDPYALRRRVLLTAVVTMVLFLTIGYLLTALDLSGLWTLLAVALLYALVVRPMMRPVREATALRRRLAYQAFLDGRSDD